MGVTYIHCAPCGKTTKNRIVKVNGKLVYICTECGSEMG